MSKTQQALDNEGRVRQVIDQWFSAVKAKDADKLSTLYADDAVVFPPTDELKLKGKSQVSKAVREWLDRFQGNIETNDQDIQICVGDDTAFAFMICNFRGKDADGKNIDMTARATVGFELRQGKWLAVHEHASFPVDTASGQARL